MNSRPYRPNELVGCLRVGDKIRTNMEGDIVTEKEGTLTLDNIQDVQVTGFFDFLKPNSLFPDDPHANWAVSIKNKDEKAWIEIIDLAVFGKLSQDQIDEVLRLRKIETDVKSLLT